METKKLNFAETFKDAFSIGMKNAPSIIAAVALWLVTIWIPYLNVGTTIAIALLPTNWPKATSSTRWESSTANTAATWASTSSRWV